MSAPTTVASIPLRWASVVPISRVVKNTYGLVRMSVALDIACRYHSRVRGSKR